MILDTGSFRDPEGFIVFFGEKVFRGVSSEAFSRLVEFEASGIKAELEKDNQVVKTDLHPADSESLQSLKKSFSTTPHFIEHARLPLITYPYEWTVSMLCDAALLQLSLQSRLMERGFSLKDATSFNIQFQGARPVFIDVLSIIKNEGGYWEAYGQFCRMFLFPLLLFRQRSVSLKSYFLSNVEGLSVEEVSAVLGMWGSFGWHTFVDVGLQRLAQGYTRRGSVTKLKKTIDTHSAPADLQKFLLNRLTRLISSLRSRSPKQSSMWSGYTQNNTYDAESRSKKMAFVEKFLSDERPDSVLDLGSNTGDYSRLAVKYVGRVVAVDSDHDSVDHLYREAVDKKEPIQAIWMDLANPSPALGFGCAERKDFFARGQCHSVLALALIHHLMVSGGATLSMVRDCLFKLATDYVLVEYINPADEQFQRIRGLRSRPYTELTEDYFERVFSVSGRLIRKEPISPTRTLFLFKKGA